MHPEIQLKHHGLKVQFQMQVIEREYWITYKPNNIIKTQKVIIKLNKEIVPIVNRLEKDEKIAYYFICVFYKLPN